MTVACEVLTGTVLELHGGRGRLLCDRAEEIEFRVVPGALPSLRRFGRYHLSGRFRAPGVFEVERADRAAYTRPDYEALAEIGIGLSLGELEAITTAAGCGTLSEYVRLFAAPETEERALAALDRVIGGERSALLAAAFRQLANNPALEELRQLLGDEFDEVDLVKIYDFLRHRAARRGLTVAGILREDPYHLVHVPDLNGGRDAAYKAAERLASRLGIDSLAGRIAAAACLYLWKEAERGHTYCEKKKVVGFLMHRVGGGRGWDYAQAEGFLRSLMPQPGRPAFWPSSCFVWENKIMGSVIYLAGVFHSERMAATRLARILKSPPLRPLEPQRLLAAVSAAAEVPLDLEQREFVRAVAENKVVLLDGEAGTGKTEVLAALIRGYRELTGEEPVVLAPTAIAARRLAERAGTDFHFTIHRFAEIDRTAKDLALSDNLYSPEVVAGSYGTDPGAKHWNTSLVVVDEMSMTDIIAFARLLSRCPAGCRLVLAGDSGQLPPVGPGPVFRELLALFPDLAARGLARVTLREIHRQENRELLELARAVRRGKFWVRPGAAGIELVEVPPEEVHGRTVVIAAELWDRTSPERVMVLTPRHYSDGCKRASTGAVLLNRELKAVLNPAPVLLNTGFSAGDPVLAIVNDYENNRVGYWSAPRPTILNGARGRVVGVYSGSEAERPCLAVDFEGVRALYYPEETARFLTLGYACTVHKAQGGGADRVVLAVDDPGGWGRDLLYTALSRARKSVTLVGPRHVWEEMAQRSPAACRSTLAARLMRFLAEEGKLKPQLPSAAKVRSAVPC